MAAREELRDRLLSAVIQAFGSVESCLDLLLRESPLSNGYRIKNLIDACQLFSLRMHREALEAKDSARAAQDAQFAEHFRELSQIQKSLFGTITSENELIRALLRTDVCQLPPDEVGIAMALGDAQRDSRAIAASALVQRGDGEIEEPSIEPLITDMRVGHHSQKARALVSPAVTSVSTEAGKSAPPPASPDFISEDQRLEALSAYTSEWDCSEAALARAASVDPADLSKWKKGLLPIESGKKERIENALRNHLAPIAPTAKPGRPEWDF